MHGPLTAIAYPPCAMQMPPMPPSLNALATRLPARVRDRARVLSFLRFVWQRVLEDDVFQAAGALAYTTVFALVPVSMVVFGVLSVFPESEKWQADIVGYVFINFVPAAASAIQDALLGLVANTGKVTAIGAVGVVVSVLLTLGGVESAFNRIWRVKVARPKLGRFLIYWTVLTLGGILAAASFAVSAWLFSQSVFRTQAGDILEHLLLRLSPVVIQTTVILLIYRVVPHRTVKWRHALAGAVLASLLLETLKWGIGAFFGGFDTYARLYGALAFVPVFLLWVFLTWTAILLGASLASSLSAFRYQPVSMRLPEGFEMYGLLRLLARFAEARAHGQGLHVDQILHLEPMLTDALAQQMLAQLCEINVVRRAESGEWLLARDLDELSMAELYEACQLRIPVSEARLPCRDDALGHSAVEAMDALRIPLRDLLKRKVGSIHAEEPAS